MERSALRTYEQGILAVIQHVGVSSRVLQGDIDSLGPQESDFYFTRPSVRLAATLGTILLGGGICTCEANFFLTVA